ncbi:MAG: glycosyltransferase [Burkholderiales bacterium]|nr:glycosyltransferase [Opitutaceae bacterium]
MKLTVAICTRNPRRDHLDRVLRALAAQTLPADAWTLLLIDSASEPPLTAACSGKLGIACDILRLDVSGIQRARLAAIAATTTPLLLFLDDDNVPAPDFLAEGLALGERWPRLGCWGPAVIVAECETPPAPDIADQLGRMACCDFPADRWSNTLEVVPPTAGLFVRIECARAYAEFAAGDPRRQLLGSTSERVFRGEDTDLVFHLVKNGRGAGQFRRLQLTHLMPARRLTPDYVVELAKAAAGSALVVNHLWGVSPRRESALDRLVYHIKTIRFRGLARRLARAHREGEAEARALIGSTVP